MKGAIVIKAIFNRFFEKKKLIGALCGFLAFVIAFLAVGQFLSVNLQVEAATDANLQAMENKLDALKKQKNEISKKLNAAKSNKAEAVKYKSYIDQQMNIVNEEVTTINELISELDRKVKDKEAEIKEANTEKNKQFENFKQVMLLTYEGGNASYIEMVLGAENFYDFLTRVERVSSLMDYCSTVMEEMRTLENKLKVAKTELETSLNAQLAYKEELVLREAELETLQAENEAYLKNIEKDISSYIDGVGNSVAVCAAVIPPNVAALRFFKVFLAFFGLFHSFYANLCYLLYFESEHFAAFFYDFTVTFCCKFLVLKLFHKA